MKDKALFFKVLKEEPELGDLCVRILAKIEDLETSKLHKINQIYAITKRVAAPEFTHVIDGPSESQGLTIFFTSSFVCLLLVCC
jgi:hypothetical protein